jgi:hypothetical protein
MGKDTTKNLVGQPIFKQIIKMIPSADFGDTQPVVSVISSHISGFPTTGKD